MCRLLGYASHGNRSLHDLLGAGGYDEFTGMSAVHKDGWGMGWCKPHGGVTVEKSAAAAATDQHFHDLATSPLSDSGIVHLRWATPPYAVKNDNTHPFGGGELAFAHNGAIVPGGVLDAMVAPERRPELTGDTDSERYFALVREHMRDGDVVSGLRGAVAEIIPAVHCSSLNALLLTDTTLYALRCHDPVVKPLPEHDDYFVLRWRHYQDSVVVASSGWSQPDWDDIPNGHVLVVDRATLDLRVEHVSDALPHMPPEVMAANVPRAAGT